MSGTSFRPALAALLLLSSSAAPAAAQTEVVAPPSPLADQLASQMRVLAQDPRNLAALIAAGELSARLDDPGAALGFFARADSVSPGDPRVLSGRARALVRMQRPGEALLLFGQAEQKGVNPRDFADDRALAYDLMGAPALAQRDYKVAMAHDPSDEIVRRYALSFGIAGQRDEAMKLLDPLLRRNDRAAWRAQAFILAMTGDVAGAQGIAQSMMPNNLGAAMAPFLARLPTMSAGDRAFAVHFGELSHTPARIADARLAPPLPAIEPAPVAVAAVARPTVPPAPDRRTRRERQRDERAARKAQARPPAAAPTRPAPPPQQVARTAPVVASPPAPVPAPTPAPPPAPTPAPPAIPVVTSAPAPVRFAAAEPVTQPVPPSPAPQPGFTAEAPAVPAPAFPATPVPAPPAPSPNDQALAAIVEQITIPAAELGVGPPPEPVPVALPAPRPEPPVKVEAKPPPVKADAKPVPPKPEAKPPAKPAAKKAPPKPDPAKLEPARYWVQVAGGADKRALPKAWSQLVAKAPEAFKGRQAWTTPLRFTNRLLAGPFKTDAAAQEFVNAVGKKGISAFSWQSEAGQKIEKLAVK